MYTSHLNIIVNEDLKKVMKKCTRRVLCRISKSKLEEVIVKSISNSIVKW